MVADAQAGIAAGRGEGKKDVLRVLDGAARAVRFSRELLYSAIENVDHGVNVIDGAMRLVAWNARFVEPFRFPPGFLRVLDERTIGFADFAGNRQYITVGNLARNPKAFLFLIDYEQPRRFKLWGEARVVEDPALVAELMPRGYDAIPERAILFTVTAWDQNCPQHIPQRFESSV